MLAVISKKRLCRPVKFKGQGALYRVQTRFYNYVGETRRFCVVPSYNVFRIYFNISSFSCLGGCLIVVESPLYFFLFFKPS